MKKLISAIALAALVGASQIAVAAPVQAAPPMHQSDRDHQSDKGNSFQKGKKLSNSTKRQHINARDYKRYHLKTPPRGYQWVRVGNNFIMVAITTGVIFSILGAIANH